MGVNYTVYGLYDALGELRYVGQTAGPLWKRLADHVAHASPTDSRPVLRWLWEAYSAGSTVTIAPLKLNAVRNRDEAEIIKRMVALGHDLLNVEHTAAKGELVREIFSDPQVRAKRSRIQSEKMTPERRAAVSALFKGVPKSPEHRAKIKAASQGRHQHQKRNADGTYC